MPTRHLRARLKSTPAAIAVIALLPLLAACQISPKETETRLSDSQSISIDTPDVPGAQCSLKSVAVGQLNVTTPARVDVERSPEIIVVLCRKPCYLDASAMISSEGQKRPDGSVVHSYPAETRVSMKPAANCNAPASGRPSASPL